jgi:hypothetical protein
MLWLGKGGKGDEEAMIEKKREEGNPLLIPQGVKIQTGA